MAEEMSVATVDGAMQQQQQAGVGGGGGGGGGAGGGGTIHSSDTLTLDTPPTAPPSDSSHHHHQHHYRQSGSHLSYVSDKMDLKGTDTLKEKEALDERMERSVSGLSGRVPSMPQGMAGVVVPYDPECGCIAPIPPYPLNA
ncbi:hypothetical protein SK128_020976, partial [Halocaridina rubra]